MLLTVADADLYREAPLIRERIGYVAQGGGSDPQETGRRELIIQGRLYGMNRAEAERRTNEILKVLELESAADRKTETYSGGMKRRLDIGLGIIHRPQLIFLDEPTTGLDPQARARMWDEVRKLRTDGMTVFLTTHYLEEADALCDRLAIIDHGKIVAEGTPDALKREVAGDLVILGIPDKADAMLALVKAQPFVREASRGEDGTVRLYVDVHGRRPVPQLLRLLDGAGLARSTIAMSRPMPRRCLPAQDRPFAPRRRRRRLAGDRTQGPLPMQKLLRDTGLIYGRSLMLTLRNPVWVFIGLMQPVLYLALYAPLLGSLPLGQGGSFNIFVPGLLVQLAMFSTFSGFGLIAELRAGVVERMRVTPISRVAMLLGRALRDVTILLVQSLLIVVIALPFGLAISPGGIILALILVGLLGLIMTTFSYTVALAVKSEDVLAPTINAVFLPVLLLSGILLPMTLAPKWLQWLAAFNPFSHAVNAMRALFAGDIVNGTVAFGVGLMIVLCAISLFFAGRAFAKSQAYGLARPSCGPAVDSRRRDGGGRQRRRQRRRGQPSRYKWQRPSVRGPAPSRQRLLRRRENLSGQSLRMSPKIFSRGLDNKYAEGTVQHSQACRVLGTPRVPDRVSVQRTKAIATSVERAIRSEATRTDRPTDRYRYGVRDFIPLGTAAGQAVPRLSRRRVSFADRQALSIVLRPAVPRSSRSGFGLPKSGNKSDCTTWHLRRDH